MLWNIFTPPTINTISKLLIQRINIPKMSFYAVAKGRASGIYITWPDCEAQVKGFPGAKYKTFDSIFDAVDFITTSGDNKVPQKSKSNAVTSLPNRATNLKRKISTNLHNKSKDPIPKKKSRSRSDSDSGSSDDLSFILMKQMDDIEQRLKCLKKGVDKIIKKSVNSERESILIEPQDTRPNNTNSGEFDVDKFGYVQVYTDAAYTFNGKNSAGAGLGVYWGQNHPLNISKPVSGRATNICGQIQAATEAIKTAVDNGVTKLTINTDSKFLINSVTKYLTGWKRNGWKLARGEPVKHKEDFKELDSIQNKIEIKWTYLEAHRRIHGNEMAEQLAKAGAAMYKK